jgi:hypothetical protein
MADFAIWSSQLNSTQIASVYNGGPGAVPTNLVQWDKMCGDKTMPESDQVTGT